MGTDNDKLKIGIDIDEVIVHFMKHFLEYSNSKKGTTFSLKDVTKYHLWETEIHSSKEESTQEVEEFSNSDFFEKMDLVEGVEEAIKRLSKHEIYFITSRSLELRGKTERFLRENFSPYNFELIHSGEVYGGKTKAEICEKLGVSVMVEDNASYALNCAKKGVRTFLMERPWNKNHVLHKNIIVVRGWKDVLAHLKQHKQKSNYLKQNF